MRDMGLKIFDTMIALYCIYFVVRMLNAVPVELGISEIFLSKMVLGRKLDRKKDFRA